MKIATEAITDPYGGLYYHTQKLKKLSSLNIKEVPSRMTRRFLCRSKVVKQWYRSNLKQTGIKGFDIVHSRSDPWFIDVCMKSKSNSCVWIQNFHALFHSDDYENGLELWHLAQNKAVLEIGKHADIRISVSKWGHDFLKEKYSIDTIVVQNGADLQVCDKASAKRFKKKYGLNDFVLFVGSFREVKNPVLFMKLAERIPGIKFMMIGDRLNEVFVSEKYKVDVPANIVCMDRMDHIDVLDAMAACRVYVMTSKHEGLPNSLLEAMGIGKPVVVPAHSGCLEVVGNEDNGFLYNMNNLDEFVSKVEEALCAPGKGKAARKRIEENFNCIDKVKQMDEIYDNAFNLRNRI